MLPSLLFEVMLIGFLGIGSQWLAWRYRMPAIVIMSVSGLLAGPILGLMNPREDFGELYDPIISVAVAIILFESSLNLNFKEIRGLGRPIVRISTIGVFLGWILGALAAHYVAGLGWAAAFVIGALFIVTGPTVIMPLLRQSKLKSRPAKILKWEGIIVDPLGALLAVFALEIISFLTAHNPDGSVLIIFFAASVFAGILGWACGRGIGWMFEIGYIPEFLKSPAVFIIVIACFTLADEMVYETGLLAVTSMGITLANTDMSSIYDMRHFKENISLLLISAIFIMVTASLQMEILLQVFHPAILGYVLLMMFIVRPLSIFVSTIGTVLSFNEKALLGWIAPRGIVALTASSYFASVLSDAGYADATLITTITFALIFSTVVAHGFSIGWLAEKLDLSQEGRPGTMIIGSNNFTVNLAKSLQKVKAPVIVVDSSWKNLRKARDAGIPFYHGDVLSEQTEYNLDTIPYDYLIAATTYDSYNALICTTFMPEYGRANVFKVSPYYYELHGMGSMAKKIGGRVLFKQELGLEDLNQKVSNHYVFRQTTLTNQYNYKQYLQDKGADTVRLYVLKRSGWLRYFSEELRMTPEPGDTIVSLMPPVKERNKIKKRLANQRNGNENVKNYTNGENVSQENSM